MIEIDKAKTREGRKNLRELAKEKYGVDTLWSWSRYNTYQTSPYEYFLRYIKFEKETRENIYLTLGSISHEIIEDYYLNKIKYEDMIKVYDKRIEQEVKWLNKKFDTNDEDENKKMEDKYYSCCRHFYKHHEPLKGKVLIEEPMTIQMGKYVFMGYVDAINFHDNKIYITDWKTSSMYTGKKIQENAGQLKLYAIGLYQHMVSKGVEIKDIVPRWNFLKYCKISYKQKNGKMATRNIERCDIVNKLEKRIKMFAKELGIEVDDFILEQNDFDLLPKEIQDCFLIEDCYVDVPINQEILDDFKNEVIETLDKIERKTEQYKKNGNDEIFCEKVTKKESFYFANLCGYSALQHKPYARYLEEMNELNDMKEEWNEYLSV